eukprot:scaffold35300_cov90-Isochrysis_galbana.AAC.1
MAVAPLIALTAALLALVARAGAQVRAAALRSSGSSCSLPSWPDPATVAAWPIRGARERCFCAYASLEAIGLGGLAAECPRWADFVSKDGGVSAGLVHQHGAATVLGSPLGNASSGSYGYVSDWAMDMGSGFGAACNVRVSPGCVPTGVHILSMPRGSYLGDCCTLMPPPAADRPPQSRAERAEAAVAAAAWQQHLPEFPHPPAPPRSWQSFSASRIPSVADLILESPPRACQLLQDLVAGALPLVRSLELYSSCGEEDEEPVVRALLWEFLVCLWMNALQLRGVGGVW